MKNTESSSKKHTQSELESIIRNGKFNSQSDANSYLQKHGLSCQMRDDGTAEIYDGQDTSNKVATVRFQQSGQSSSQSGSSGSTQGQQNSISSIDY